MQDRLKDDELLTRKELMQLLRISLQTVIRWEKKGTLKPVKPKRTRAVYYWKSDINKLLKEGESQ